MKSQWSGSSAAFTQIRRRLASAATEALTPRSSVAAKTTATPRRSPRRYVRKRTRMRPSSANLARGADTRGLTTMIDAPASSRPSTFRSATTPPPTTRTGRPARSRTTGYGSMAGDRVYERAHRALLGLDVRRHAILTQCGRADGADRRDGYAIAQPGGEGITQASSLRDEEEVPYLRRAGKGNHVDAAGDQGIDEPDQGLLILGQSPLVQRDLEDASLSGGQTVHQHPVLVSIELHGHDAATKVVAHQRAENALRCRLARHHVDADPGVPQHGDRLRSPCDDGQCRKCAK